MRKFKLLMGVVLLATVAKAQQDRVTVRTEHEIGKAYLLKQAVLPWKPWPRTFQFNEKLKGGEDPNPLSQMD